MSDKAGMEDRIRQQYQIQIKLASEENQLRAQWDSVMTQTRQLSLCIEEMAKRYHGLRQADCKMADVYTEFRKHYPFFDLQPKDPAKETLSWIVSDAKKLRDPSAAAEQVVQMTLILSKLIQEPPGFDDA
jgi:hypothetical protein